jgi:hypothetical protein
LPEHALAFFEINVKAADPNEVWSPVRHRTSSQVLWVFFPLLLLSVVNVPCAGQVQPDTVCSTDTQTALNPRLAVGCSIFLPGAGQLYNGEGLKGAMHLGLFAGSIAMVVSAGITETHESITPYAWFSVAMVGVTYVWAAIDAYTSAVHINEMNGIPLSLSVGPLRRAAGVQATFTVRL